MTTETKKVWLEKLQALQDRVTELKSDALREMPAPPSGSHWMVNGLAAVENIAWALKDSLYRYPSESETKEFQGTD